MQFQHIQEYSLPTAPSPGSESTCNTNLQILHRFPQDIPLQSVARHSLFRVTVCIGGRILRIIPSFVMSSKRCHRNRNEQLRICFSG